MSLYEKWQSIAGEERSHQEQDHFWQSYFEKEKNIYQRILAENNTKINGVVAQLAEKYEMSPEMFSGFMDGINTSLTAEISVEELEVDTLLDVVIDFEKLYFNMLDAKAEWLYNLEEWDGILSKEKRLEITKEFRSSKIAISNKVGRNDPCPCGSGKKFKKCCGA